MNYQLRNLDANHEEGGLLGRNHRNPHSFGARPDRCGFVHCALMLLSLALSMLWPIKAEARNQALLIGISNYRLDTIPKLKAPENDVALMWDLLQERGFNSKDITVLADEIDPDHKQPIPHELPTANNILRDLDALTSRAEKTT